MSILEEFNSSELILMKRDIHSLVTNLSFLKMTPCLNTGE